MTHQLLQIHPTDNVGIAIVPIPKSEQIEFEDDRIVTKDNIPQGHKVALRDLPEGSQVLKYGFPIGKTIKPIARGEWIHTHNISTLLTGKLEYRYHPEPTENLKQPCDGLPQYFDGYVRPNGEVGVRNEIWILNTVGCINKTAENLARMADKRFASHGIDGVYHFPHPYGCSQLGDDLEYTRKALAGLARHPNAAGVLVIGLGCENNQIDSFRTLFPEEDSNRLKFLSVQAVSDEFAEGMELIEELVAFASQEKRVPVHVSKLKIGLKCGGSDGFSGISANPLVGAVSDLVIQAGGTALLTEVPEMFGAETILMSRAANEAVFEDIVWLINDFKDYYIRHNQVIYENPSPGNKDGGISTLEEKSLGCTQKGGAGTVTAVRRYGEPSDGPGLELVQSPGNDMVSVTALIAAGAHIVLFTTGRGTPMGGAVPTVKISSNSELFERKRNWIDFDAGQLLSGRSISEVRQVLYQMIIDIASGRVYTRNELSGFREIAIFKDGVTL